MKKSNIITEISDRLVDVEEKLKTIIKPSKKKSVGDIRRNGEKPEVDEDVCPECGGDLLFVEDGIVFCSKCSEYYELKDLEEE